MTARVPLRLAYQMGADAYTAGLGHVHNPFKNDLQRKRWWTDGYNAAYVAASNKAIRKRYEREEEE